MVRKGSRAVQQVPASADAFVWLRLYQRDLFGQGIPRGRRQPLWWTLRRPYRPLTYHAAHRMFERVNAALGADWTLHDLRHSAATRMAHDPQLSLSTGTGFTAPTITPAAPSSCAEVAAASPTGPAPAM